MNITGKEAKELGDQVIEAAPGLGDIPVAKLREFLEVVIAETTRTNNGVELRINEAGSLPPEILMTLAHYGALTAIYRDLPPGDTRRAIVEAGEKIGAFIATKYGDEIQKRLAAKTTKH